MDILVLAKRTKLVASRHISLALDGFAAVAPARTHTESSRCFLDFHLNLSATFRRKAEAEDKKMERREKKGGWLGDGRGK